jgi:hypothetical protein
MSAASERGGAHLVTGRGGMAQLMVSSSGQYSCECGVIGESGIPACSGAFSSCRRLPVDLDCGVGAEMVCAWSKIIKRHVFSVTGGIERKWL